MIKEITKKWLLKNNACQSGINDWEKETNHETIATIKRNIERNPKQANWIITKVMNKEQNKKYALFAALQVSPLWAKKYPEEAKIWKRWIKADADADAAANAASYAVYAAATTDAATTDAAYAATAAYAAADAAAAANAANAAYAAAYAANAAAAAKKEILTKILNYGLSLLLKEK